MKYPPPHHQEAEFQNVVLLMKYFPLATLITSKDDEIFTTHLPLYHEKDDSTFGKLVGHIDIYNPQSEQLNGIACTVIFHGPESYISPADYSTTQLPTWNYVKAHIKGTLTPIHDEELIKKSLIKLTENCEPQRLFVLEDDNPKMKAYLPYIKGFEISIRSWEGKFKLSQDKNPHDFELARKALTVKSGNRNASFLDELYPLHKTLKNGRNG